MCSPPDLCTDCIVAIEPDPDRAPELARQLRAHGASASAIAPRRADDQAPHRAATDVATDAATGLPTRAAFERRVDAALSASNPPLSALMLISVDDYARINDGVGQLAADAVALQFVRRLQSQLPADAVLGRLSHAEFGLFLPALAQQHNVALAGDAVRAACAAPFAVDGGAVALGMHGGVALRPADAEDAATLIKHACAALHQARKHASGTVLYYRHAMDMLSRARFEMESALHVALERGQFELYYQPKVDVRTGRLIGAEALLRWHRPGHGIVAPADFIPLLEETGLIVPVGAWVIDQACHQMGAWEHLVQGPMHVAVNIAARQFADTDLAADIGAALARHGVRPDRLALDIAASALTVDTAHASAKLAALRALGMQLAIDDLGNGHASLAHLHAFPVDTLKIDRSAVRDVAAKPSDASLVAAIIVLAHSLHLTVVAEGVETPAQLAFLAEHGCDQIQGYLYGKPVPAAAFERLLLADLRLSADGALLPAVPDTLLLVDADSARRDATARAFADDGYHIVTADSGDAAWQVLAAQPVQLMLCEGQLDGRSAGAFAARVQRRFPAMLRVVVSAAPDVTDLIDAVNAGTLYRFFSRPIDNGQLRRDVRNAFDHYWHLNATVRAPHRRRRLGAAQR